MYEDLEEDYNNEKLEEKVKKASKDGFTFKKFKDSFGFASLDLDNTELYFLYEQEVLQKY